MWTNNGVGNNGEFQNNSNQDGYHTSPFGGPPGQQYFPFQQNMMQFESGNGEGFMNNAFQPEVGLYNDGSFSQNQFVNAETPQYSPPQFKIPTPNAQAVRPIPTISSRAAELRAQLLKGRERAGAATPPVGITEKIARQQAVVAEGSSSMHESPRTPTMSTETSEQELNINELISQYADPKPAADTEMNDSYNSPLIVPRSQRPSPPPKPSAKSQVPSLGSPTKVTNPNGKIIGNGLNTKNIGDGHASSGSVSEGEIFEDGAVKEALPASEPKEIRAAVKPINKEKPAARKPRDEQQLRSSQGRPRDSSPAHHAPRIPKPQVLCHSENRRDEIDLRQDRRLYTSDQKKERRPHAPESEKSLYQRRDVRDQNEDHRRSDTKPEDMNISSCETQPPTLSEILPHDEDLREWLEITGYHNGPYRSKILNRRRAIAALDAQRNALLAEMEAEERGGVQAVGVLHASASAMLPPPLPNKAEHRAESYPKYTPLEPEIQRDRVISNKRPYSDIQEAREESSAKVARTSDRGRRIKEEEEADYGHPRSSSYDASRRRPFDDRRDERDPSRPRHDEVRGRGRRNSRERELSPSRMAYKSRSPTKIRSFGAADDFRERDDWEERDRSDRRPFEVRGAYRGRAFDPNYRGRTRGGRGRGDYQTFTEQREQKVELGASGGTIANSKPFKDHKGFNSGGKGETRYFIVKSFNEENVMRCIEDGVWTTQVQNGPLFKEAFETSKNVILVFSINKSRAFQGYARMESLPGSVEMPAWQRAINWESAGAFNVKWLVICSTRFHRIGHLKNALNDNQAVLIGKDGQEIEENCGRGLIELIDEEASQATAADWKYPKERVSWEEY